MKKEPFKSVDHLLVVGVWTLMGIFCLAGVTRNPFHGITAILCFTLAWCSWKGW